MSRAGLGSSMAVILVAGAAAARTPLPPHEDRSVFDAAGVIEPGDAARLETQSRELLRKTGVALVVLTVPRLEDETIEELAVRFGTERGVGRRGEDRGVVVAFALEDRKIFVATGYGVEGYLPDGRVGALLDRYALPHFRKAQPDYSGGLVALAAALAAASAKEHGVTLDGGIPVREPPAAGPGGLARLLFIVLFLIVAAYLGVRHPWLLFALLASGRRGGFGGGGGFGSQDGFGGFGGGGFGGGGAGRSW